MTQKTTMTVRQKHEDWVKHLIKQSDHVLPHAERVEEVLSDLPVTVDIDHLMFDINVYMSGLTDPEQTEPVVLALLGVGWGVVDTHTYERGQSIRLTHADGWPIPDVWLRTAYAEGAACEFVQVGTKERPVYEMRCAEAAS